MKIVFTVFLDTIITVYMAVILIIALSGSFFLQLGPLVFSISHVQKPLLLVLAALLLRKTITGSFAEGLFSSIPFLKYGREILLIWLRNIEAWLTASLWRGIAIVLAAAGISVAFQVIAERLPFEYGLQGEYYSNSTFNGEPLLVSRDSAISVQRFNREYPEIHRYYSIRWTGFFYAPRSGNYTFSTASDDGSWLFLDGKQIVNNGGSHGLVERFGSVSLKRGVYPLDIRYVQQEGAAAIRVRWSPLHKPMRLLSEEVLFASAPPAWVLNARAFCRSVILALKVFMVSLLAVIALHYVHPATSASPRLLPILWLLALSFSGEFWLLRHLGLKGLPLPWELLLWCLNIAIVLLALGIPLRRLSLKTILQNATLLLFSLALLLGFFELVLRTGIFDERGTIWIREKFKKLNDDINAENWELANKNPYRFTDIVREKAKPDGVSRVAVLGDSFVWGASIPYEKAWGHKLAKRIEERYQALEVMNWGYPGWSTANQFNFLSTEGIQYAPDLLLLGFVRNDPDLGNYRWKLFDLRTMPQWYVRAAYWPFKTLVPNVFDFTSAHLNEFLMNYLLKDLGYGWQAWYDRIYSPQNLQRYYLLLQKMAELCNAKGIRVLFVLTPATYGEAEGKKLGEIASMLDRLGIEYLDLYPATVRELSHYPPRKLWGNPGDPHPGELMTELFANESFAYLEERNILSTLTAD